MLPCSSKARPQGKAVPTPAQARGLPQEQGQSWAPGGQVLLRYLRLETREHPKSAWFYFSGIPAGGWLPRSSSKQHPKGPRCRREKIQRGEDGCRSSFVSATSRQLDLAEELVPIQRSDSPTAAVGPRLWVLPGPREGAGGGHAASEASVSAPTRLEMSNIMLHYLSLVHA